MRLLNDMEIQACGDQSEITERQGDQSEIIERQKRSKLAVTKIEIFERQGG